MLAEPRDFNGADRVLRIDSGWARTRVPTARSRTSDAARLRHRRAGERGVAAQRPRSPTNSRRRISELAVETGLRADEVRTPTWGAVDLERGRARVNARFAQSRREQTVDLHDELVQTLRSVLPKAVPAARHFTAA